MKTEQITGEDLKRYANELRCIIFCMKTLCPDIQKVYIRDPYGKKVKVVNDFKKDEKQMMEEYEDYITMLEDEAERIGQEIDKICSEVN